MVLLLTGIVAVFFLGLALASLRRPAYAFALTLVMYPFEQLLQSQFTFFVTHRSFMNFFAAGVAGVAVVLAMIQGRKTMIIDRVAVLVGSLYVLVFASVLWSINPSLSWFTLRYWVPYLIAGLLIVPLTINNARDVRAAVKGSLVAGVPLAVALAVAPMRGRGLVLSNAESFEMGNPLAVGTFGAELAVLAIGSMLAEKKLPHVRAFLLFVAALGAFVTLRSGSRGQLIAAMVGIAIVSFGVMSGARRKNFLLSFIPACILLGGLIFLKDAFVSSSNADWIEKRWSFETIQATFERSRLQMATDLLYQFFDAASRNALVLIGGLGAAASYQLFGHYCHVVPVEALCEYGIIGAVLYGMIAWAVVQSIRIMYRSKRLGSNDKAAVALIAGLFAMHFALTFKQGSLFGHTEYFGLGMIIGRLRTTSLAGAGGEIASNARYSSPSPMVPVGLRPAAAQPAGAAM